MANIPFLHNAYFTAKVGIETDSPQTKLQIGPLTGGDGTAQERLRLTGDYTAAGSGALLRFTNQHNSGSNPNTGEYNLAGIIGYDYQSDWGGAIGFQTAPSSGGGGNLVTRMVINQFGDVGIGDTSPLAKLEVAGSIKVTNSDSGHTSEPGLTMSYVVPEAMAYIETWDSKPLTIRTYNYQAFNISGTEAMRITSAGGISFGSTGTAYGTSGQILKSNGNASPTWIDGSAIPGVPAGSGTLNTVPLWTPDGDTLGDSPITISGNDIISSGRSIIENTTALTTGVTDSLVIKTLSSGTSITNGFGGGLSFYLENTVYSAVNEVGKIAVIETDTIAIDDKMVFSVKDNNILAERLTLTGSEAVFTGNVGIGVTGPGAKLDIVGGTLGLRIKKANLSDVLRVYTQGSGIFMDSGNVHISDDLKIGSTLLSNQENTDIDSAAAEVVAQVSTTDYTAAFFDFVVKKTTNVRSGTVYACHDGTNVEFTETSTNDLGDTSDVTLSVDISGTNMRLLATVTSDDWSVKSLIRAI